MSLPPNNRRHPPAGPACIRGAGSAWGLLELTLFLIKTLSSESPEPPSHQLPGPLLLSLMVFAARARGEDSLTHS